MTELETRIAESHAAVAEFVATVRSLDATRWNTPRAEGAWSPAQIAEHVAKVYEYSRDIVMGTPTGGSLPRFLRPLLRRLVVDSTLRAGQFTRKGRAPAMFRPSTQAASAPEAIARLEAATAAFEAA